MVPSAASINIDQPTRQAVTRSMRIPRYKHQQEFLASHWTDSQLLLYRLAEVRVVNDRVLRDLARKLLVEVARVDRARDRWLERRLNLLGPQALEVDMPREEGMALDLLSAVDAESSCRVAVEQLREQ